MKLCYSESERYDLISNRTELDFLKRIGQFNGSSGVWKIGILLHREIKLLFWQKDLWTDLTLEA